MENRVAHWVQTREATPIRRKRVMRGIITRPEQLDYLRIMAISKNKFAHGLLLRGSIEDHPQRIEWEKSLNASYLACGCDTGKVGLVGGILVGAGCGFVSSFYGGVGLLGSVVIALLPAAIGALSGKVLGLLRAQKELRISAQAIRRQWDVSGSKAA
jgi:hypothetical protein